MIDRELADRLVDGPDVSVAMRVGDSNLFVYGSEEATNKMRERIAELEVEAQEYHDKKENAATLLQQAYHRIEKLKDALVEERAMRICTIPSNWRNEGEQVKGYFRSQARDQLSREMPEIFGEGK